MDEWEKTARNIPCGRTKREKCCSNDRSQVISHTEKGYSTYCFRCGPDSRRFRGHGVRSLADMIQHRRELDEYIQAPGELSLQTDFAPMSDTTPHEAWAWLLKSGVSSSLCRAYGIGWSDALARVVLPVWSNRDGGDKRLAVVQSRAVLPGQKPKYLNKTGVNSQSVLFWSLEDTLLEEPVLKDTVILHEDMLSTIRVGRLIPAVASLGTSLSAVAAAEILSKYSTVIIWYDGDEAGRRGARKARRTLKLQGAEVRVIRTDEDPKEYNNDEIKKIVARA